MYIREYNVYSATENWMANPHELDINGRNYSLYMPSAYQMTLSHKLKRLEVDDCINAYATNLQVEWGNVILVSKDNITNGGEAEVPQVVIQVSSRPKPYDGDLYQWICEYVRVYFCIK
jgi:hypothetical protein